MSKYIFIFLTTLLLLSCFNDETYESGRYGNSYPLVISANIVNTTRAAIAKDADKWSYTGFESGDAMGFYSPSGNLSESTGKGKFVNQCLVYDTAHFRDPNGAEFSPTQMSDNIFMYYPYGEGIGGEQGMELRRYKTKADIDTKVDTLRCVDLLTSYKISLNDVIDNKKVALYGTFDHAFAELIIMRGEGFDNPPAGCERITAVLREPYTNIKVDTTTSESGKWECTPKLVYEESVALNLLEGTGVDSENEGTAKEEAKKWHAWWGGNYAKTNDENDEGVPAWWVIVPTLGSEKGQIRSGDRSYVDYIELYDNDGYLHRVSGLKLSGGNTKYVDGGWRYPMEIAMKELVPTVSPYTISPWGSDIDLTDARTRGINNLTEFEQWVRDYNLYLKDNSNDNNIVDALLKYGDKYVDPTTGKISWHFYVLNDLDLSGYNPLPLPESPDDNSETTANNCIVPQLRDILDGISTTLVAGKFINHTITGLSKTLIDKIGLNGSLQNFDIIEPEIKDENIETPIGIIANMMDGASVVNCNIDKADLFAPNSPAGIVVGEINDESGIASLVKDCILSGFLITNSTLTGEGEQIVGKIADESKPNFENNDTTDIVDPK